MPASPFRPLAIELCKKYPTWGDWTIAKKLHRDIDGAEKLDTLRNMVRHLRGNRGKQSRKANVVPRREGTGHRVELPKSMAEERSDYVVSGKRVIGVLGDVHVPFHDVKALRKAILFLKKRKIDDLFLNGDVGDFYAINSHETDPKKRDLENELLQIRMFLKELRKQFPKARIYMKEGNHEERWQRTLNNKYPEVSSNPRMALPHWLHLDEYRIDWIGRRRRVMIGPHLEMWHGHEFRGGGGVNPAMWLSGKTRHNAGVSHFHRTSSYSKNVSSRNTRCWSIGCLCELSPWWLPNNNWNHGFAVIDLQKDGTFDFENYAFDDNGKVYRA